MSGELLPHAADIVRIVTSCTGDGEESRNAVIATGASESFEAGKVAGAGTYACSSCGCRLAFEGPEAVPSCPECGGKSFSRVPLFGARGLTEEATAERPAVALPDERPPWLEELRTQAFEPGAHLAYEDEGEVRVVTVPDGWCRVGRSPTADIRFNDPTVSRRHALLVRTSAGIRVLDDRSLNGIEVNGEIVDWGELVDGDELRIGRYRLYLICA